MTVFFVFHEILKDNDHLCTLMPSDSNISKSSSTKSDAHMGITFNEVRSDEPHEAISVHVAEKSPASHHTPESHLSSKSPVFDVTRAFNNENVEMGMIVSDKRKERPSLLGRFGDAFNEWWGGAKVSFNETVEKVSKQPEKATPVVLQKAETRASVVREATTHVAIAPKADHKVVITKSRTFGQDVARIKGTPITVKAPEPEKKTEWSHVDEVSKKAEPAILDLRGATVAPIIEKRSDADTHTNNPKTVSGAPSLSTATHPQEEHPAVLKKTLPDKTAHVIIPDSVKKIEPAVPVSPVRIAPEIQRSAKILPGAVMHARTVPPIVKPILKKNEIPTWASAREEVPETVKSPTPTPVSQKFPEPTPIIKETQPIIQPVLRAPEPVKRSIQATFPPVPAIERTPKIPLPSISKEEFHTSIPVAKSEEQHQETLVTTPPSTAVVPLPPVQGVPFANNSKVRIFTRWVILSGITIFAVTLAVVLSIYLNVFEKDPASNRETVTTPSFFAVDSQVPISLGSGKEEFLASLTQRIQSAPEGLTQFYPTVPDGAGVRPVTSDELLAFMSVNLSGKTIRTLDKGIMIGSISTSKNEPFIVIRSYNFDVLFSGLLAWEPVMYSDLAPLFGTSYSGISSFTDAVTNNKSIRILTDSDGKEILLYSFISQNTVVITTSGEALSKLISRL